jgi:hypothetical protein
MRKRSVVKFTPTELTDLQPGSVPSHPAASVLGLAQREKESQSFTMALGK